MQTDLQMFIDHANGRHRELLEQEKPGCHRCIEQRALSNGELPPWASQNSCFACGQANDYATVKGPVPFCGACIHDVIADWLEARYSTRGS